MVINGNHLAVLVWIILKVLTISLRDLFFELLGLALKQSLHSKLALS